MSYITYPVDYLIPDPWPAISFKGVGAFNMAHGGGQKSGNERGREFLGNFCFEIMHFGAKVTNDVPVISSLIFGELQ